MAKRSRDFNESERLASEVAQSLSSIAEKAEKSLVELRNSDALLEIAFRNKEITKEEKEKCHG